MEKDHHEQAKHTHPRGDIAVGRAGPDLAESRLGGNLYHRPPNPHRRPGRRSTLEGDRYRIQSDPELQLDLRRGHPLVEHTAKFPPDQQAELPALAAISRRLRRDRPDLLPTLLRSAADGEPDLRDIDADGNTTEARRQIGDPLHARPVAVEYGSSAEDPDTVVFVSTNDGFLHAMTRGAGGGAW